MITSILIYLISDSGLFDKFCRSLPFFLILFSDADFSDADSTLRLRHPMMVGLEKTNMCKIHGSKFKLLCNNRKFFEISPGP